MTMKAFNVLFLCTGNSARSILAESLLNHLGQGRFIAFSAGSHPTGKVNTFAVDCLKRHGIPVGEPRSKSWDEFAGPGAPELDFVVTVCDNAAGEVCPAWPGQPITAHWGVFDPAALAGSDDQKRFAFTKAFAILERRISLFTCLNPGSLERLALQQQVRDIGNVTATDSADDPSVSILEKPMKKLEIFDPALCCSSGVCGTEVDQSLVTFAADLDWAKQNGARIERFNLAQQPLAFAENVVVKGFLERSGQEGLPLILLDGEVALAGRYPSRAELARWAGIDPLEEETQAGSGCCSGSRCC